MLIKTGIDVSFAQGLDTKTDPKRVAMGNFVSLENTVFTKGGLLQKRNGYGALQNLPNNSSTYLTTLNGNLTAIGTSIAAYSEGNATWYNKGSFQPLSLSTLPLIRNNYNQTLCDSAVAPNGLVCTLYLENNGSTTVNKYVISDSNTGQNITSPALIPVTSGTVSGGMRVFVLNNNFILVFTNTISGTAHLQYVAISSGNPTVVGANTDIASNYVTSTGLSWDGVVGGGLLYLAYNTTAGGGQRIDVTSLSPSYTKSTSSFIIAQPTPLVGYTANLMSISCAFASTGAVSQVYVDFYTSSGSSLYTSAFNSVLNLLSAPLLITSGGSTIVNITGNTSGVSTLGSPAPHYIYYEITNVYSYGGSTPSNYISSVVLQLLPYTTYSVFSSGATSLTIGSLPNLPTTSLVVDNTTPSNIPPSTQATKVSNTSITLSNAAAGNSASTPGDQLAFWNVFGASNPGVCIRSVGLASKAFVVDGVIYFLAAFTSTLQKTYFLINGSESTAANPVIVAKLAYENGGGYLTKGLPGVTVTGSLGQVGYLYADLITAVNKNTNVPTGTQVNGIYSQTGVNLASFTFGGSSLTSAEIGSVLNIAGGFLWMYDGYLPVEQGFFLFPDVDAGATTDIVSFSTSGGSVAALPTGASSNTNAYYFQFTYEWTDNQGNTYRSAPSVPVPVTTSGSGTTGSFNINIPSLRLTMKTANPVKVCAYRWSVGQQEYYQSTSITVPELNSTTADLVSFTDQNSDATILGNNLIYTTGGVVEDINAPATSLITLFDTRLWLVDAEDPNLLYYSKQVIEATPVEMSDLFTFYVAPTTASEGSTGPITAIAPMDDKLIIWKANAIYYINGTGPDNTGANNNYSNPIFVTSTVGSTNQNSIVFTPSGLMFQSNKGIWLLGRDLSTTYIGAPVEQFNTATVESAQNIPGTNQVRFLLSSGVTLMYDYYYQQWGTFVGVPGISSCLYQNRHTFINSSGDVYQETPDLYLDGSNPVLMQFTTGPLRLDNLQSYQRAYRFYLLGNYITPHKIQVSVYYDYSPSPSEFAIISPTNFSELYGEGLSNNPYGQGNPYGGPNTLEEWRVNLQQQRCKAFAIGFQEIYDGTYGVAAGAGLTLSGINLIIGVKKKWRPTPADNIVGAQ